jgi:hypothetical protein
VLDGEHELRDALDLVDDHQAVMAYERRGVGLGCGAGPGLVEVPDRAAGVFGRDELGEGAPGAILRENSRFGATYFIDRAELGHMWNEGFEVACGSSVLFHDSPLPD